MSGKTYEIIDMIMAIENIGHVLKKTNTEIYNKHYGLLDVLENISGSLEIIASKMGDDSR